MVWVDASGRLTGPLLRLSQARGQAVLAAVLAPIVLGLLLLCVGGLAHLALGRRRMAAWGFDWQMTGATRPAHSQHAWRTGIAVRIALAGVAAEIAVAGTGGLFG